MQCSFCIAKVSAIVEPAHIKRGLCLQFAAETWVQHCEQKCCCAEDAVPRILGGMQDGLNQPVSAASYLGAGSQSMPALNQVHTCVSSLCVPCAEYTVLSTWCLAWNHTPISHPLCSCCRLIQFCHSVGTIRNAVEAAAPTQAPWPQPDQGALARDLRQEQPATGREQVLALAVRAWHQQAEHQRGALRCILRPPQLGEAGRVMGRGQPQEHG